MTQDAPTRTRPVPRAEPSPPQRVRRVDDALLTPFTVERQENPSRRLITGAVYDDGVLVAESQRSGGTDVDIVHTRDPERVSVEGAEPTEAITGRWLYGGHLIGQFGHFICETVTNLWPKDHDVDGVLFHTFLFGRTVTPWIRDLVTMAGWDEATPLRVLGNDRASVETLFVPTRPFTIAVGAAPEAVAVWDRIAPPAPAKGAPVFLSRSRLTDDPRRGANDAELDGEFSARGFRVLHPQALSIRQQVEAVRTASCIAGVSGSALHLTAFAGPDARVIEIGDSRSETAVEYNPITTHTPSR